MFPPWAAEVIVLMASPMSGATPTVPSIGFSGSGCPVSRFCGSVSVTVPASTSTSHHASSTSSEKFASYPKSRTFGASRPVVHPIRRFGTTACNCRTSVSPASAPFT